MYMKVVYEGHRVKVKFTEARKCEIHFYRNVKLRWTISAKPILVCLMAKCTYKT